MGFSHHPLAMLLNPNTLLPGDPGAPGNLYVILFRPQTPCHAACLRPVGHPLLPTLQHHEQQVTVSGCRGQWRSPTRCGRSPPGSCREVAVEPGWSPGLGGLWGGEPPS